MSNFPALDVALGLSFVFFVLSLVCSALNEAFASFTARRAKFLAKGLRTLLNSLDDETTLNKLYAHPLVSSLIRRDGRKVFGRGKTERYPSYLPSRVVVRALLDLTDELGKTPTEQRSIEDSIAAIKNEPVQDALMTLYHSVKAEGTTAAKTKQVFLHRAEQWYDDAMERVSGWYRRRVQLWLWAIAIVVAFVLNADTLQIGRTLWTQPTVRSAVAQAAEQTVKEAGTSDNPDLKTAVKDARDLQDLNLPIGWKFGEGSGADPRRFPDWFGYAFFAKLIGLLLTATALTLGAPFWFDTLSRFARLRSSGAPPPSSDATRHGEGEQTRQGPAAPPATTRRRGRR